jgi:hypothetical protein
LAISAIGKPEEILIFYYQPKVRFHGISQPALRITRGLATMAAHRTTSPQPWIDRASYELLFCCNMSVANLFLWSL